MATLQEFENWVISNLAGSKEDGLLRTLVPLPGGRDHLVIFMGNENTTVAHALVASSTKHLQKICEDVFHKTVGGVSVYDGTVFLQEAIPLADVDASEIVHAVVTIAKVADELEKKYEGGDKY